MRKYTSWFPVLHHKCLILQDVLGVRWIWYLVVQWSGWSKIQIKHPKCFKSSTCWPLLHHVSNSSHVNSTCTFLPSIQPTQIVGYLPSNQFITTCVSHALYSRIFHHPTITKTPKSKQGPAKTHRTAACGSQYWARAGKPPKQQVKWFVLLRRPCGGLT